MNSSTLGGRDDAYSLQDLQEALQDFLLRQLLGRDHPGGILGASVLEAVVFTRLQGLNPESKVAATGRQGERPECEREGDVRSREVDVRAAS